MNEMPNDYFLRKNTTFIPFLQIFAKERTTYPNNIGHYKQFFNKKNKKNSQIFVHIG